MIDPLPSALAEWAEAPRVRALNARPLRADARYVLCWVQQALRAVDNPLIDAAVRLGNALGLPVLVYHGLREDYPYASARLHRFILGASRDLARGCGERGLRSVAHVDRDGHRERGLVYRLAADAAAVLVEDQPAFVAQWQADRFAGKADVATFAVNAACLVPPAALPDGLAGTSAFRRAHERVRDHWSAITDVAATVPAHDGALPFAPEPLAAMDDAALDALVAACAIDRSVPVAPDLPGSQAAVAARLERLRTTVLPAYARARNDASRAEGASALSPYLHFGLVGPRAIVAAARAAACPDSARAKFLDELLVWREWFHYKARGLPVAEAYARLPPRAVDTLAAHERDPRPELQTLSALIHGETPDATWNACQKQFLIDGWMHNNLRMYWAKRLIAFTPDPETAWATACYLNDRFSLDGRDPSTYGNIAWSFGDAKPGDTERPVYGWVATKSDGSIRNRDDGPAWIAAAAARAAPRVTVPDRVPFDPYVSGRAPAMEGPVR